MQQNQEKHRQVICNDSFLLLHFLVCSVVLLRISLVFGWNIYNQLPVGITAATFNDFFMEFSYFPKKPSELLGYSLAVGFLSLYYLLAFFAISRFSAGHSSSLIQKATASRERLAVYFGSLTVAVAVLFAFLNYEVSAITFTLGVVAWLVVLLAPIAGFAYEGLNKVSDTVSENKIRKPTILLIGLLTIQIFSIFVPYIFGTPKIRNDYMDIPEQTLLGGRYVDNTDYINAHRIGGLLKYSPQRDHGQTPRPRPGTYVVLQKSPLLIDFIQRHDAFPIFTMIQSREVPAEIADFYLKSERSRDTRYYYNDELGALVLTGKMTRNEKEELDRIVANDQERANVNALFFTASANEAFYSKRNYSREELSFLQKNKQELTAQSKAGWFFHHHSHMFAPINEFALGKPFNELNAQYGKLNAAMLAYFSKALGGVNFQNYFKTLYAFYPIYLALALITLAVIFKSNTYVLLGSLLIFSSFLLIGEELLFIAPGFNPIRHFFDLPTVLALYFYVTRGRLLFLTLAMTFGLLAVIASAEFGIILMIALMLSVIIYLFAERDKKSWAAIGVTLFGAVAAVVLAAYSNAGDNPMLLYYVMGVSSPSIENSRLLLILGLFSAFYLFALKIWRAGGPLKHLFLFLFLYTQGMVIYYVWNSGIHHLLALAPIWVLMFLVMLKLGFEELKLQRHQKTVLMAAGALVMVFLYLPSLTWFYLARLQDASSFKSHKTFAWQFPTATIQTTMEPMYFTDSVNLIQKYSRENKIYIISKYDNFLPFLARKYSAMPFVEVATSLVSPKEINRCVNAILLNKPEYIYVDTDINRNLNGDIYNELDPVARTWGIYSESFSRVKVLNLEKQVFDGVRAQYEPVQKGLLITVYKRKG